MEIIIARHGETQWNKKGRIQGVKYDIPLSEKGITQAHKLGSFIKKQDWDVEIFSSPLIRALKTSQIVAGIIGIPENEIIIIDELMEMSFGNFQGQKKSEIKSNPFFEKRKKDKLRTRYPCGDSYEDLFLRLRNPINEIIETAKSTPLIVGHESVNRIIPSILNSEKFPLEQVVYNRQKNDELILINKNKIEKINFSNS